MNLELICVFLISPLIVLGAPEEAEVKGLDFGDIPLLDIKPGQASYLVGIWKEGLLQCSGALIGKEYVLTAATCLIDWDEGYDVGDRFKLISKNLLEVRGGDHDIHKKEQNERKRKVREIKIHPNYIRNIWSGKKSVENDIAVIRLNEKFSLSGGIQLARLPPAVLLNEKNRWWKSTRANIVGWERCAGRYDCTGSVPKMWNVLVGNISYCYGFDLNNDPTTLQIEQFCTSNFNLATGSLTMDQQGNGTTLFGIQSGLLGQRASIHTRVGNYVQWIERETKRNSSTNIITNFTLLFSSIILVKFFNSKC